jgi:hypothetical protein
MKKYFLFYPLLVIILVACEDVIPVKLGDKNVDLYVVEAKITTKDKPFVILEKSLPVNVDLPLEGVSGAIITIADNAQPSNIVTLIEDKSVRDGYYTVPNNIDYYGVISREYTVTIESQGVTLQAKDVLSPVESIDSISVGASKMADGFFLSVFGYSLEPKGLGNYYKWDIYINDTLQYKSENLAVASDELVDGNYVNGLELFIDFYENNKKEDRKLKLYDTVYVTQNSISAFTYEYYMQMLSQIQSGRSLFSPLAANVKGNFTSSDGKVVLGLFTAQDVSKSNLVVINKAIENQLKQGGFGF